jgi:L-proline amide hydrolase
VSIYDCQGTVPFEDGETWYGVVGDLSAARAEAGPAPLVTLHGGPGAVHDYLLSMADLARDGRAVVFYDQIGNGRSSHFRDRGASYYTVLRFARQLAGLIQHLGVGKRYHVLGQSWGGFLALEHALTHPLGLRSIVLSNTGASFPDFVAQANLLRAQLPPDVEATLRRHEAEGTTADPEYEAACQVFYRRHVCRLDPWPEEIVRAFAAIADDPTVYYTTNGPSEFHVVGSFKDWQVRDRLGEVDVPALVISGRYDEATPALQEDLVTGIPRTRQVILEHSSHLAFWEERDAYMTAVGEWLAEHD